MALYDYAFSLIERRQVETSVPDTLPIAGGTDTYVPLTWTPPSLVLRREDTVRVTVELPAFAWAPIAAGDAVGSVRCRVGDRTVAVVPITATAGVDARPMPSQTALLWRRFKQVLSGLLR